MTTDLKMPQLGESVTEGTIGRWLKQPGDPVQKYEPLLQVITDKVDTEVPAPESGTLLEILVPEGETVRVGTVIARLGAAGAMGAGGQGDAETMPVAAAPASAASVEPARNTYLSPVVGRLLAEHRIDPAQIAGTGQGGRITKQDVLRFVDSRAAAPPPAPAPQPNGAPGAGAGAAGAPGVGAGAAGAPGAGAGAQHAAPLPPPAAPALAPGDGSGLRDLPEDAELVPLTPMRRMIAEHMSRSVRTSPHVTAVIEVDLSRVVAHRAASAEAFARQGVRLTFTPYFVQAAVAGLLRAPILNGSFSEQGIVLNRRHHIGVAVALDEGLLVPVIRDADERNLLGLARAVNDLAERARARRLRPDETQGGTFTITNHGTTGSLFATPIINQPQAGILGVGAIVKRPVVVTHDGVDAIAIKPMCYLSLTFDHRIADGATGDAFLGAAKAALETVM